MAMIARPIGQKLGPAIPTGFGAVMKWLSEQDDGVNCPWCGDRHDQGTRATSRRGRSVSQRRLLQDLPNPARRKRKVSAYQREFGRQLKKLKKAHPRTPVTRLMKRAHSATKKARRGK